MFSHDKTKETNALGGGGRRWRRSMAFVTAFASTMLSLVTLSNIGVIATASAAEPPVKMVQALGSFNKFYSHASSGKSTDSEFRFDFVMEVPKGTVLTNGAGLILQYDFSGNYKGSWGNGVRADNQRGWNNRTCKIIPTMNLGIKDINNQYRIVRIDNQGAVDWVTITMQGDLGKTYDKASPMPGNAPFPVYETMQAVVRVGGVLQYMSYQWKATVFDSNNSWNPNSQKKASAVVGQNYTWGMNGNNSIYYANGIINSQTAWGYVVTDNYPVIDSMKLAIRFMSPWANNKKAIAGGACTSVTSFYYQWVDAWGTPTSNTPIPVQRPATATNNGSKLYAPEMGVTLDMGPIDFSGDGPGYYKLVVWPIAVNPSLADPTTCFGFDYYAGSVGDLDAQNAFTVGSVFVLGS